MQDKIRDPRNSTLYINGVAVEGFADESELTVEYTRPPVYWDHVMTQDQAEKLRDDVVNFLCGTPRKIPANDEGIMFIRSLFLNELNFLLSRGEIREMPDFDITEGEHGEIQINPLYSDDEFKKHLEDLRAKYFSGDKANAADNGI